jgi:hypothetical protein
MKPISLIPLLLLLAAIGCDARRHDYSVVYQESAFASLDLDGKPLLLTARASFADVAPTATHTGRDNGDLTADDRFRYVTEHPEIYGRIDSRREFEEQFGDESTSAGADAAARGGASIIDIVAAGRHEAVLAIEPSAATVVKGGQAWSALDREALRLAVGPLTREPDFHDEGAPVRLHFPELPEVAARTERLTEWQIVRHSPPPADPIELTVRVVCDGRPHDVVFRFERVATHPNFPPNPLYRLYQAH